jgi:hypothetical protein
MYIGLDRSCRSYGDTTATAPDAANKDTRRIAYFITTIRSCTLYKVYTVICHRHQEVQSDTAIRIATISLGS